MNSWKERGRVRLCKSKHALNEWHQRRSPGVNSKWSWCGCGPNQTIFLFLCFTFISLSPQLVIRSLSQVLFIRFGSVFIVYELSRLTCERSLHVQSLAFSIITNVWDSISIMWLDRLVFIVLISSDAALAHRMCLGLLLLRERLLVTKEPGCHRLKQQVQFFLLVQLTF